MKKYFYSVLAASMLFACSQEDIVDITKGEGQKVTFTVEIPEVSQSRAVIEDDIEIGQGKYATHLIYAQYETDMTEDPDAKPVISKIIEDKTDGTVDGRFIVDITMAKDIKYDILFMAYNPENNIFGIENTITDANVKDKVDLRKLTLKNELLANQEAYDAFVHALTNVGIDNTNKNVPLKRPFAQVNAITTNQDLVEDAKNKLGIEVKRSSFTIYNAPNTYNVFNGKTTTVDNSFLTYDIADMMSEKDKTEYPTQATFDNTTDQYYLASVYVLAGDNEVSNSATHRGVFKFYREKNGADDCVSTLDIPALPIQRNYRTNVIGNLLTKSEEYTIEINANFGGDHDHPMNGFEVSTIDGLQAAINKAIDGVLTTITLTRDIPQTSSRGGNEAVSDNINIPTGKNIILDLNGHTYSWESNEAGDIMIENKGKLIIKDATEQASGKISYKYTGQADTSYGKGNYTLYNRGTLVVESGTIENVTEAMSHASYAINTDAGATLTINGGKVLNKNGHAIRQVSFGTETNNVTINGGYIEGTRAINVQLPGSSISSTPSMDLTINDGELKSNEDSYNLAVYVYSNGQSAENVTLIINGGILNGNVALNASATASMKTGAATVTGGTFNGEYGIFSYAEDNSDEGKIVITGGTFATDYSQDYVAEGYSMLKSGDVYKVVRGIKLEYNDNGEITTYSISHADGLEWIASNVVNNAGFAGNTIELETDIDLATIKNMGDSFAPIGSTGERDDRNRLVCEPFKGTFDGNGKTIKGLYQSGWDMGYEWGQYGSVGLFSVLEGATVKNVVLEGFEAQVEGGDISFIAGSATGDCVFENIEIKNSKIGTYNNGCGGIIGWSGAGTYTFKNIKLDSDVVLGGLWGSFDSSIGGIVGQAEPGATYNFENVEINCRIDAYNDCTASYDYYNYRMCGMIIGRCEETTTIDGVNYPDLSKYNMTFNNVTVNYGTWMNYHYCEPTPGTDNSRGMRIEPGYAYGGLPADFDHTQCVDNHYNCIPFDQLIGGDQLGVKGLREVKGVTVNYPDEYTCTLCGEQHNVK